MQYQGQCREGKCAKRLQHCIPQGLKYKICTDPHFYKIIGYGLSLELPKKTMIEKGATTDWGAFGRSHPFKYYPLWVHVHFTTRKL